MQGDFGPQIDRRDDIAPRVEPLLRIGVGLARDELDFFGWEDGSQLP
jgi:hypothetical protein